jgi:hypothetical protein
MRKAIWISLFLLAVSAGAADLTGKWIGTADSNKGHVELSLQLRQAGAGLSGTLGTGQGQDAAITSGKVDGAVVTFDVQDDQGTLWHARLTAAGEGMSGEATGQQDGQTVRWRVVLKRA